MHTPIRCRLRRHTIIWDRTPVPGDTGNAYGQCRHCGRHCIAGPYGLIWG